MSEIAIPCSARNQNRIAVCSISTVFTHNAECKLKLYMQNHVDDIIWCPMNILAVFQKNKIIIKEKTELPLGWLHKFLKRGF